MRSGRAGTADPVYAALKPFPADFYSMRKGSGLSRNWNRTPCDQHAKVAGWRSGFFLKRQAARLGEPREFYGIAPRATAERTASPSFFSFFLGVAKGQAERTGRWEIQRLIGGGPFAWRGP